MRLLPALFSGLALSSVLAVPALALDYRSAGEHAVLYAAPSAASEKRFIVTQGTPVELVLKQDAWSKVRDSDGNMAWIVAALLSPVRTVLVRVDKAEVHAEASDKSAVVFSAAKSVLLDLVQSNPSAHPGWARVRHRDGQGGFIKASQVWGL
jgi:SH3-like domain-containing protein